jgi:hypothetical protein
MIASAAIRTMSARRNSVSLRDSLEVEEVGAIAFIIRRLPTR